MLDSGAQHSVHLDQAIAAEIGAIESSAACGVGGGVLLDNTVVADAMPAGSCTLGLQLLSPPAALRTSGALSAATCQDTGMQPR